MPTGLDKIDFSDSKTITVRVFSEPKPKKAARPGFHGKPYNASRATMDEWIRQARHQIPEKAAGFDGPVQITLFAFFVRPGTHYRRKIRKRSHLRDDAPVFHTQAPDCDNLAKFLGDCLSGLAFRDDRQVSDFTIKKRWTVDQPRWIVKLTYPNTTAF